MRILERIGSGAPVFSFEFFPPKTVQGEEALYRTIDRLRPLQPDFVSVTYGAGGSTRTKTIELVSRIKHELGIEAMAHITCVGASRDQIATVLDELRSAGIENVLPLRGDPPRDQPGFERPENGFGYASELVQFIRERNDPFCLGAACYPEGHVECVDRELDLTHLQQKVEAGVDFLITQLFFDNADYFEFVARARARGIELPIVAGIMPITNVAQIQRFTSMCGATIPAELQQRLEAVRDDEDAVREIGVSHATAQCVELLEGGAPGIHFYTLNQSIATRAILERLRRG
ncbi:MAG TPA: methylenetetrahydrofolate reductase [NAD(P)H] [Terriglobales bacterium]|nr:methylenetetrahydrofolate reductase [NAD(P)H] [Terriglobales bacterium]